MQLDEMKAFILSKTSKNAAKFGDRLPSSTYGGRYRFVDNGTWVGGFWTGLNYLCYEMGGDAKFLESAGKIRSRLTSRLYREPETLDHDIGFLFSLSAAADYKLTGDSKAKRQAIDAADILLNRYRAAGRFIQAWNVWEPGDPFSEANKGRIIIDSTHNMPLLYWASGITGDSRYAEAADAHLQTCSETLVRDDFSTFHTYLFHPETGERIGGRTYQGYADMSCWSRGQAWAIGGFAHAFRYTGKRQYLEIAEGCARVFMDSVEEDLIPMWDFRVPDKAEEPRDTSAAAIAAAGLLEISRHAAPAHAEEYREFAGQVVRSLYENYSTRDSEQEEGLLLHACCHRPENFETDCSLIYGDYFFAEAVARLGRETVIFW